MLVTSGTYQNHIFISHTEESHTYNFMFVHPDLIWREGSFYYNARKPKLEKYQHPTLWNIYKELQESRANSPHPWIQEDAGRDPNGHGESCCAAGMPTPWLRCINGEMFCVRGSHCATRPTRKHGIICQSHFNLFFQLNWFCSEATGKPSK